MNKKNRPKSTNALRKMQIDTERRGKQRLNFECYVPKLKFIVILCLKIYLMHILFNYRKYIDSHELY